MKGDVTGINPGTSVGFGSADPLAGRRRLYALLTIAGAIASLRSAASYARPSNGSSPL